MWFYDFVFCHKFEERNFGEYAFSTWQGCYCSRKLSPNGGPIFKFWCHRPSRGDADIWPLKKIRHQRWILAIRKPFQCILRGVRVLLANQTQLSATSETLSYCDICEVKWSSTLLTKMSFETCNYAKFAIRNRNAHFIIRGKKLHTYEIF